MDEHILVCGQTGHDDHDDGDASHPDAHPARHVAVKSDPIETTWPASNRRASAALRRSSSTLWAVSFPLCDEDEQEAVLGCLYINAALIKPADRRLLGALHVHGLPGGSCATSSSDPLLHAPAKAKAAVNLNEAEQLFPHWDQAC